VAGFRPEHLELGGTGERLTIRAKADVVEYLGNEELLHVTVPGHETDVIAVVSAEHNVKPGDVLDLQIPAEKLHLFDSESGDALAAMTPAAATA
jgi:sn-glycerol 3-phosphate transport system ATP-binding protein